MTEIRASDSRGVFLEGVRVALTGPALYVAISLMGVGALARAAGFPVGAAALSTLLLWAGPAQVLFFGAGVAKTAPPAIALAVSLSSVRLLPMCLSVLPMLREKRTRLPTLFAAAHFIAVTVWAESLRRLPERAREERLPFFFGLAVTCMGLTTFSTALGFWLAGRIGGWWDRVPHALFFVGMAVLALSGMVICAALTIALGAAGSVRRYLDEKREGHESGERSLWSHL